MNLSTPRALAVELRPYSRTHWVAIYYPMVDTPAGRWADVTWPLHQHLIRSTEEALECARWLDLRSPDPDHSGYAGHRERARELAAGYTAALSIYHAEAVEEPLSLQQAQQLREATVVVPAGGLAEWVLDDLQEEPAGFHG